MKKKLCKEERACARLMGDLDRILKKSSIPSYLLHTPSFSNTKLKGYSKPTSSTNNPCLLRVPKQNLKRYKSNSLRSNISKNLQVLRPRSSYKPKKSLENLQYKLEPKPNPLDFSKRHRRASCKNSRPSLPCKNVSLEVVGTQGIADSYFSDLNSETKYMPFLEPRSTKATEKSITMKPEDSFNQPTIRVKIKKKFRNKTPDV